MSKLVESLCDFIIKNSQYTDREKIKDYILLHFKYGTFDYALDKEGEVAYVCRWNMQGRTANILDLIIAPKLRNKRMIKMILRKNLERFPYIKFLVFHRERKYPDREIRSFNIKKLLQMEAKLNV